MQPETKLKPRTHGRSGNPANLGRPVTPSGAPRKANLGDWISGARPQTLALAIAPVVLGTGAGAILLSAGSWHPIRAGFALIVALFLQIGVNYANDYSDGIRGTDLNRGTDLTSSGPLRLTGSGLAKPKHVLIAAMVSFGIAALAGIAIVIITQQWWLIAVGALAIAAAWFYTGGKRPYGYYGLGELSVFVFFGMVATCGSAYIQALNVNSEAWLSAVGAGLLACAVLMVNNLRDAASDSVARKRTLAVLLGPMVGRILFVAFTLLPFGIVVFWFLAYPKALLVLFGLLAAIPACVIVIWGRKPRELLAALRLASLTALVYGVGLGLVFLL